MVTGMARQMVINYGMSDIGPWSLMDPSAQQGDMIMRMMARNSMSENLQQRIDDAVKKIATEAYQVRAAAAAACALAPRPSPAAPGCCPWHPPRAALGFGRG
jgi:hypothetical protein